MLTQQLKEVGDGIGGEKKKNQVGGSYGELILDAGDVEQGFDLLPQTVPRPVTQLSVFAQVALDDLQSDTESEQNKNLDQISSDCQLFGCKFTVGLGASCSSCGSGNRGRTIASR